MSKKKVTTEEKLLKDLWNRIKQSDPGDLFSTPLFDSWYNDYAKFAKSKQVKVGGFSATLEDIGKIVSEVEGSCLSASCKKSLLKALKNAIA